MGPRRRNAQNLCCCNTIGSDINNMNNGSGRDAAREDCHGQRYAQTFCGIRKDVDLANNEHMHRPRRLTGNGANRRRNAQTFCCLYWIRKRVRIVMKWVQAEKSPSGMAREAHAQTLVNYKRIGGLAD